MSMEATGRRLDYLYRKADEAAQARADLDACRATVVDTEKTVACEQHTTSTLVCRMQVRFALPAQLEIRTERTGSDGCVSHAQAVEAAIDAELRGKQEAKDILERAAANVNQFNALASRVDSLGTQVRGQETAGWILKTGWY
jgi:hypothetical protein